MLIKRRDGQGGLPARPGKRRGGPPPASDAYEDNWYRVLARMAENDVEPSSAEAVADRDDGWGSLPSAARSPVDDEAEDPAHQQVHPSVERDGSGARPRELVLPTIEHAELQEPDASPSSATPNELVRITGPLPPPRHRSSNDPRHTKGSAPTMVERPRVIHANVRIGVRKVVDPDEVYVGYLTRSAHADYFRSDWWPGGRSLTPVHLWRANHLGAAWELDTVRRFMVDAAPHAERMLGAAPFRESPGTPARRAWFRRLLEQDWVQAFGVPRIVTTLHALAPELVPAMDAVATPWVRSEWFGVQEAAGIDPVETWLDVWELLEDVLVLRGDALSDVVRNARERAPGRAPMGRLGLLGAMFMEAFWREASEPAGNVVAARKTEPESRRSKRRSTNGGSDVPAKAPRRTGASASTKRASSSRTSTAKPTRTKMATAKTTSRRSSSRKAPTKDA